MFPHISIIQFKVFFSPFLPKSDENCAEGAAGSQRSTPSLHRRDAPEHRRKPPPTPGGQAPPLATLEETHGDFAHKKNRHNKNERLLHLEFNVYVLN